MEMKRLVLRDGFVLQDQDLSLSTCDSDVTANLLTVEEEVSAHNPRRGLSKKCFLESSLGLLLHHSILLIEEDDLI